MTEAPASNVSQLSRRRISGRRRAAIRMAELYRLALHRQQHKMTLAPDQWVFALAATLASAPPGASPIEKAGRAVIWRGLDLHSLRYWTSECQLGEFSDDELATVIRSVEQWRERAGTSIIRADLLAGMLSVTAEARWICRISTIDAVDETKIARAARLKAERQQRDRERIRAKRAGKHQPRATYLEQALTATKPWEAEGISRRTWERHRARVASMSPDLLSSIGRATDLRQPAEHPKNTSEAA